MRLSAREARDVKTRVELARRHAAEVYHPDLDRARRLYAGEQWDDGKVSFKDGRIVVNYLQAYVEILISSIGYRYPEFRVKPQKRMDEQGAPLVRDLLTYTWNRSDAQEQSVQCLRDRFIGGLGVGFTTWEVVEEGPQGEAKRLFEGARPEVLGEEPDPTTQAQAPQVIAATRKDEPRVAWIDPKCFWICPETTRSQWKRTPFLGYTERLPLRTVKMNARYKNTRDLKASKAATYAHLPDEFHDLDLEKIPEDLLRVDLHHYIEWERKIHVVVTDSEEREHLVETWPWPFDRYPVRLLLAPGRGDRFWPVPPLVLLAHPQMEINQARTILSHHQRQSSRKLQTNARLSERNRRQLKSAGELAIVELEGPGEIREVPHAQVQPEIFRSEISAREDLQFLGGLSAYEMYQEPTKRTNVPEVAAIQQAGQSRANRDRDDFEKFVSGLGLDVVAWLQQYSVATREFPVFDAFGEVKEFRDYTKEEIAGDYLVEVYVGSMQAPNRQTLTQDLAYMLQALTNGAQSVLVGDQAGMNFRFFLRQLLSMHPEIREVEKIVPDQQMAPGLPGGVGADAPPGLMAGQGGVPPGLLGLPDGSFDMASMSDEDLAALAAYEE